MRGHVCGIATLPVCIHCAYVIWFQFDRILFTTPAAVLFVYIVYTRRVVFRALTVFGAMRGNFFAD